MDMKISGAGVLSGGEYEEVRISGSAKLEGSVRCRSFACSGAAKGEGDLSCLEEFRASGSARITGAVRAGSAQVSGSLHCGSLAAEREGRLSGSVSVDGKLSGGDLRASGSLKVGSGIEAEAFRSSGCLRCQGLLNAETIEIILGRERDTVTAIGGGSVLVSDRPENDPAHIFGSFGAFDLWGRRAAGGSLTVEESIEADDISLVNTICPLVSGRRVVIGPGCKVETVRYSESIEIDPDAQVGRQEQI